MNMRSGWVAVLFVMAAVSNNSALSQEGIPGEYVHHQVGVVHHDIAESSPVISATISYKVVHYSDGDRVLVHVIFKNISDHDISYHDSLIVMHVTDSDGKLAPEWGDGCRRHWFSPCYYTQESRITIGGGTQILKPGGKVDFDLDPNTEYDFTRPGTYSAVGYISGFKEGPEYFKTNTITIKIE